MFGEDCYPDALKITFFEAIGMFLKDLDYWSLFVVQLSVRFFIPSVFMLIFSIGGKRKEYVISAGVGIALWLRIMVLCIAQNGFSEVPDFDDCSISIGI